MHQKGFLKYIFSKGRSQKLIARNWNCWYVEEKSEQSEENSGLVPKRKEEDQELVERFFRLLKNIFFITVETNSSAIRIEIITNGIEIEFEVDTGCPITLIPEDLYDKKFSQVDLQKSELKLVSYTKKYGKYFLQLLSLTLATKH